MTHTNSLFIVTIAGSAVMLLTALTLKPISGVSSRSPEHAAAIDPYSAAGEATFVDTIVASPTHSDREV